MEKRNSSSLSSSDSLQQQNVDTKVWDIRDCLGCGSILQMQSTNSRFDYFKNVNVDNAEVDSTAVPPIKLQVSDKDNLSIQICSDLHLEFYNTFENIPIDDIIIPNAPILALLGDIGLAKTELLEHHTLPGYQI